METSVNNKCRAFTSLSQSKKLAEILPLESADMFLAMNGTIPVMSKYIDDGLVTADETAIPCWSLASLLNVLPTLDGRNAVLCKDIRYDEWHICYHSTATLSVIDTERYNNPVDACVAMIEKLHELKML